MQSIIPEEDEHRLTVGSTVFQKYKKNCKKFNFTRALMNTSRSKINNVSKINKNTFLKLQIT